MTPPGQVATLILPGDTAWDEGTGPAVGAGGPARAHVSARTPMKEAARVLRSGEPAVLLLTGLALREKGLELAARIAAKTGAQMLAQTFNRRMERGAGRISVERIPYPVDQALRDARRHEAHRAGRQPRARGVLRLSGQAEPARAEGHAVHHAGARRRGLRPRARMARRRARRHGTADRAGAKYAPPALASGSDRRRRPSRNRSAR